MIPNTRRASLTLILSFATSIINTAKVSAFVVPSAPLAPSWVDTTSLCRTSTTTRTTPLFMAKKKKGGNKKSSGSVGIKGFGSSSSKQKGEDSATDAIIDRSKEALSFYNYIEQNGSSAASNLKRVALGHFPIPGMKGVTIRGVVAMRPIKKGEIILGIPYEMALNLGKDGVDPTLPAFNLLQEICRAGNGKEESGGKKNIEPYIAMLPKFRGSDCLGSTDFFSEDALDALQSPLIKEETLERRKKTMLRYERDVKPLTQIGDGLLNLPDGSAVTEEHMVWAVWLITSRVLTVQGPQDSGMSFRLMIPFIDMCNHDRKSPHVLTGRAEPGGMLKVVAGANIDSGEQINICYGGGVAGNDRFVQDYGFLDSFDNGEAYDIVAKQLLGKMRVMEAGSGGAMRNSDRARALESLQQTSIEEDEATLATGGLEDAVKTAIEFRLGVKRALKSLEA